MLSKLITVARPVRFVHRTVKVDIRIQIVLFDELIVYILRSVIFAGRPSIQTVPKPINARVNFMSSNAAPQFDHPARFMRSPNIDLCLLSQSEFKLALLYSNWFFFRWTCVLDVVCKARHPFFSRACSRWLCGLINRYPEGTKLYKIQCSQICKYFAQTILSKLYLPVIPRTKIICCFLCSENVFIN